MTGAAGAPPSEQKPLCSFPDYVPSGALALSPGSTAGKLRCRAKFGVGRSSASGELRCRAKFGVGQSVSLLFMLSSEHFFPLHISFLLHLRPYISQISSAVQTGETKCIKKDFCHTRTFPDSRLHLRLCFPLSIRSPCKDKHERKARQGKKARTQLNRP